MHADCFSCVQLFFSDPMDCSPYRLSIIKVLKLSKILEVWPFPFLGQWIRQQINVQVFLWGCICYENKKLMCWVTKWQRSFQSGGVEGVNEKMINVIASLREKEDCVGQRKACGRLCNKEWHAVDMVGTIMARSYRTSQVETSGSVCPFVTTEYNFSLSLLFWLHPGLNTT